MADQPISVPFTSALLMPFNRITTTAGLFAGLGTALWTLFEFAMGWHGPKMEVGAVTGFIGTLFPLVAIVWALRKTKAERGGRLTLNEALMVGLSVSLILAGIGLAFYQVYYTWINPEFLRRLNAGGASTSAVSQLITVVAGSVAFGVIVSLVGGLVLRTRATRA